MSQVTQAQVEAIIEAVRVTGRLIAHHGTISEGELYARLMPTVSLENFQKLIRLLVHGGLVSKRGFLLTYIGPPLPPSV